MNGGEAKQVPKHGQCQRKVGKLECGGRQYAEEKQSLQGDERLEILLYVGNLLVVRRHPFSVRKVRAIRSHSSCSSSRRHLYINMAS